MNKFLLITLFFLVSLFSAKADNDVSAELKTQNTPGGWDAVQLPELPNITSTNTFNITSYGASTSSLDNTAAIQAALNAVPSTGGMVVIPAGTWLCGPITVKSKTIVHISKDATLKLLPFGGTTEANKAGCYPSNGKNSSGLLNYDVFISNGSTSINDVIVEGEGTTSIIDGQGRQWWDNYKSLGTRPSLIRFKKGMRFLFRNFKLLNSPGTNLTLGGSGNASHFTVHDVTISAPSSEASSPSHNTDGIPIWGPYANIYNCDISTGDDNVVVDSDGHHIHAWNIKCGYGHGMSIGSYTSRVHDVIYEDITFNNTGSGFRIKSAAGRSGNNSVGSNGAVSNIICRNATMTGVAGPIKITSWYDSDDSNPANVSTPSTVTETTPEFCDILFQNITANAVSGATSWKHACPVYLYGRPEMYIHNIILDNVKINSKVGMFLAYCKDIIFKNGCKIVNEASSSKTINVQYQNSILGKYDGTTSSYDGTPNPSYGVIEENSSESKVLFSLSSNIGVATASNTFSIGSGEYIKITPKAGEVFKSGDKISVNGTVGSNEKIFGVYVNTTTELKKDAGSAFNPTMMNKGVPTSASGEIKLSQDATELYLSRYGGTTTTITDICITRGEESTPAQPSTFSDFTIDFTTDTYTVKSGKLPTGTTVSGKFHDSQHGYQDAQVKVPVSGMLKITVGGCQYSNNAATIYDGSTLLATLDTKGAACGGNVDYYYTGPATTLTINLGSYCPFLSIVAITELPYQPSINPQSGFIEIGTGSNEVKNGEQLVEALKYANANATASAPIKIFLRNGTYNLGSAIKTLIKNHVSLIGESTKGVLIVNHPEAPGMNNTETLYIDGENFYAQDLSIRCDVSYASSKADGVGIAVQIKGDKGIFKNVDLQGNQDTFLSSGNASQRGYFLDGRIEGTVDYICGGGDFWFENTLLYNNKRSNADVIAAPSTSGDTAYGYVFYNCTVDGDVATQANKWNFARGWKDRAAATWINTKCLINPSAQGYANMTKDLAVRFHEYNTRDANGNVITGHNLNGLGYSSASDAIYLSSIGKYTYNNVVKGSDNWDAAAIASQVKPSNVSLSGTTLSWSGSAPAYLIEDANGFVAITTDKTYNVSDSKGTYTVRAANARGGFGEAVKADGAKGTLLFTAAVQGGSNAALKTLNEERHYYNNWGTTSWAAQAYIGFSVSLPEGKQIKSAVLKFTSYCGGNYDGRKVDVYCLSAQDAASFDSSNPELNKAIGSFVASETDNRTQSLKTIDASSAVKDVTWSGSTSPVIFQLGGAAAGAQLYGKPSSLAPTLELEFEDYTYIPGDVNRDGQVNIIDLVSLISYLNNPSSTTIDKYASDMDKDRKITKNDAEVLGQKCLGM